MEEYFYTIQDEDGKIRPMAFLWKDDENLKYHQPDIDKILKKDKTIKLVKIKIETLNN
jgi:hypothetical protein